jgi:hypothetical protein
MRGDCVRGAGGDAGVRVAVLEGGVGVLHVEHL